MAATYEPIATTTLGSAASSITFSSIAASWTDLRLVLTCLGNGGNSYPWVRFNNDSGTNYSRTVLYGNGTSAVSANATSDTKILLSQNAYGSATIPMLGTCDIFSYAGSTYKSCLTTGSSDKNGSGNAETGVGMWLSTSAINRLDIVAGTTNFATGTTATLYGIKAA